MVGEGDSVRFHERKCDTFLRGNFAFLINCLKAGQKQLLKADYTRIQHFLMMVGSFFFNNENKNISHHHNKIEKNLT